MLARAAQCFLCFGSVNLQDTSSCVLLCAPQRGAKFAYAHSACFEDEDVSISGPIGTYETTATCTNCQEPNAPYYCCVSGCESVFHYGCLNDRMFFTACSSESMAPVFPPKRSKTIVADLPEPVNGMYRLLCPTHMTQKLKAIAVADADTYRQMAECHPTLPPLDTFRKDSFSTDSVYDIPSLRSHGAHYKSTQQKGPRPLPTVGPAPATTTLPVCSISAMWAARHLSETLAAQKRRDREEREKALRIRFLAVQKARQEGAQRTDTAAVTMGTAVSGINAEANGTGVLPTTIASARVRSAHTARHKKLSSANTDAHDNPSKMQAATCMPAVHYRNGLLHTLAELSREAAAVVTGERTALPAHLRSADVLSPAALQAKTTNTTAAVHAKGTSAAKKSNRAKRRVRPRSVPPTLPVAQLMHPYHLLPGYRQYDPRILLAEFHAMATGAPPVKSPLARSLVSAQQLSRMVEHFAPLFTEELGPVLPSRAARGEAGEDDVVVTHTAPSLSRRIARLFGAAHRCARAWGRAFTERKDTQAVRRSACESHIAMLRKTAEAEEEQSRLTVPESAPAGTAVRRGREHLLPPSAKSPASASKPPSQAYSGLSTTPQGHAGKLSMPLATKPVASSTSAAASVAADLIADSLPPPPSRLPVRGVVMERLVECFLPITAREAVEAASEVVTEAVAAGEKQSAAADNTPSSPMSAPAHRRSLGVPDMLFTGEPLTHDASASRRVLNAPMHAPVYDAPCTSASPASPPLPPAPACSWQAQALSELQTGMTMLLGMCSDDDNYRTHANAMAANALLFLTRMRVRVNKAFWTRTLPRQGTTTVRKLSKARVVKSSVPPLVSLSRPASATTSASTAAPAGAAAPMPVDTAATSAAPLSQQGFRRPALIRTPASRHRTVTHDHGMASLTRTGAESLMLHSAHTHHIQDKRSRMRRNPFAALSNAAFWRATQQYVLQSLLEVERARYLLRFKLRYGSKSTFAYDATNRYGNYTLCVAGVSAGSGLAGTIGHSSARNGGGQYRFKRVRLMGMGGMSMGASDERAQMDSKGCSVCDANALSGSRKRKAVCTHKTDALNPSHTEQSPITSAQIMARVDPAIITELRRAAAISYSGIHFTDTMATHAARTLRWTPSEIAASSQPNSAANQRAKAAAVWLGKGLAPPALTGSTTLLRALERTMMPELTGAAPMHPNDFCEFVSVPEAIDHSIAGGRDPRQCIISIPEQMRRVSFIPREDRNLPALLGLTRCLREPIPVKFNAEAVETALRVADARDMRDDEPIDVSISSTASSSSSSTLSPKTDSLSESTALDHMFRAHPGLCLPGLAAVVTIDGVVADTPPRTTVEAATDSAFDHIINFNRRKVKPQPPRPASTALATNLVDIINFNRRESRSATLASASSSPAPAEDGTEMSLLLSIGPADEAALLRARENVERTREGVNAQLQTVKTTLDAQTPRVKKLLALVDLLRTLLYQGHKTFGAACLQVMTARRHVGRTAQALRMKEKERLLLENMFAEATHSRTQLTEQLNMIQAQAQQMQQHGYLIPQQLVVVAHQTNHALSNVQTNLQQLHQQDAQLVAFAHAFSYHIFKFLVLINSIMRVMQISCDDMRKRQVLAEKKIGEIQSSIATLSPLIVASKKLSETADDLQRCSDALQRSVRLCFSAPANE